MSQAQGAKNLVQLFEDNSLLLLGADAYFALLPSDGNLFEQ